MALELNDDTSEVVIVCVGDKYAKTTSILDTCLRWDVDVWYPVPEECPPRRLAELNAIRTHFERDKKRVEQHVSFRAWSNHQRNDCFLSLHSAHPHAN